MNLTLTGDVNRDHVNMKRRIEEQEKLIKQVREALEIRRGILSLPHYTREEWELIAQGTIRDLAECERALAKVGKDET